MNGTMIMTAGNLVLLTSNMMYGEGENLVGGQMSKLCSSTERKERRRVAPQVRKEDCCQILTSIPPQNLRINKTCFPFILAPTWMIPSSWREYHRWNIRDVIPPRV